MPTTIRSVGLCWLLLCPLSVAVAQDMVGSYALTGAYSTGDATTATLRVTRTPHSGRLRTVREATIGGQDVTWFSGPGRRAGARLYVVYEVEYTTGAAGAVSGAAGGVNRFLAVYRKSGSQLRESVYNLTRRGPESAWARLSTQGAEDALHPFRVAAHGETGSLASAIMEFRTDIADYYEPGDEDYYRDDSDAAEAAFQSALWDPVTVPQGFQAHQALAAHLLDPAQVVEGRIILLFDDQARVTQTIYDHEGDVYTREGGSWDWQDPTPPAPPPPGPGHDLSCAPGSGITTAEAIAAVDAMDGELADWIMTFRVDIADYYDWGDQAYYEADERAANEYFDTATYREVPIPAGYTAHKAIRIVNSDPADVILGTITVLLDCQGKRITFVYDHEGEVYDEDDL
jgi:hypothetical protein